jgi:hypothetical protein
VGASAARLSWQPGETSAYALLLGRVDNFRMGSMQKKYSRKLRAIEGASQANQSERRPIVNGLRRLVVVHGGLDKPHLQDVKAPGGAQYLRELESENAALRNTAIKLALEIQALQGNQ